MRLEVIIVMQLVFNAIVIAALLYLRPKQAGARRRKRALRRPPAQESRRSEAPARPRSLEDTAPPAASSREESRTTGLDDLVESANTRELAAERALRARLAHFRQRVAQ